MAQYEGRVASELATASRRESELVIQQGLKEQELERLTNATAQLETELKARFFHVFSWFLKHFHGFLSIFHAFFRSFRGVSRPLWRRVGAERGR